MTNKQEDRVYDAQIRWIRKEFGDRVETNLGWGVDDKSISTKIYGEDGGILTSWIEKGTVKHDFEPF